MNTGFPNPTNASSGKSRSNSINHSITSNKPPEHLSEFYSFMSNKTNIPISPSQSSHSRDLSMANEFKNRITRQPSINTFTSFSPSVLDLPNIVTLRDFQHTIETYRKLLDKSENLRAALLEVSNAANEFGQALEDTINECPKVHNSKTVHDGLINAGGLQYMIGSNQQILSRLILQSFQEPLAKELKSIKDEYDKNYKYYQQEVKAKSKVLREKELENIKLSKSKTRNLTTYKNNLLNLTNQLDEIDRLKYDYYHEVNSLIERFNQKHLLVRTGSLIRAQLEIYEGIAKKGWSGGGLDELLSVSPDLFAFNYDSEGSEESDNIDKHAENTIPDESVSSNEIRQDEEEVDPDDTVETVRMHQTESETSNPPLSTIVIASSDNILGKSSTPLAKRSEISSSLKGSPSPIDESFSLPVINNTNSLLSQRSKFSDNENSPDTNTSINNDNLLEEFNK